MNGIAIKFLFSMLAFVIPVLPAFGAEVTATVDRNQVGIGDVVNFSISISSQESINIEEPRLPGLDGFELINTSTGVEMRHAFQGGQFVSAQTRTFNYMLAVTKQGTLHIPSINVVIDGKAQATQAIQITASNARKVPPRAQQRGRQVDPFGMLDDAEEELFNQLLRRNFPGGGGGAAPKQLPKDPAFNPDEAFFVRAEVDKETVYAGEQVTASFYLYTRGQIRDIDTLKYPTLKGFWKEEIEMATRLNFESVIIGGLPYTRALLVSYALFPIKAGKATVDSYKAKCTVISPTSFGFGRPYQFTKASRPVAIEVREVPTEGRPMNFTGAVGRFRMSAAFEPATGSVNQPVTLRVRIDGQGNAKLIELPKLDLPPSLELYDQKTQAKFLKDGTSYKEFEVLIIPREPGVFKIPPLEMAVFDPQTAKFTTVASQELNLTVTGSASVAPQASVDGERGESAPSRPALPPLATQWSGSSSGTLPVIPVTIAVYMALCGFLATTAWRKLKRKPRKVSLRLVLQSRLKNIRDLAATQEYRRVGVEMTNAAYSILGQLSEAGSANQELAVLLEKSAPSLRRELAQPIEKLLAQCEALSFAPEAMIGDMTEKTKLQALITEFERVLTRAIELGDI